MRRFAVLALLLLPAPALAEGVLGYYRDPALHGETVVFAAEGDLWTVGVAGGLARRLTTHPGEETSPTISPDGETLAFSATYEGPTEVYTMPVAGGLPTRRTWEAERSRSPLADPSLGVSNGDVITMINGADVLEAPDPGALLRNQAGRQVRVRLVSGEGGETRDEIVVPVTSERDLRHRDWQYTRRLEVEEKTEAQVGYVHLRAMGGSNLTEWYRQFYPVFNRPGLIIDVRNNNGGNIDSIILEKLLRRAWFYWRGRVGTPYWNMQYAFRGHVVVLCNQQTASDGEAFAEGIRRLDIGKVIGKRTWGGEIWLSSSNRLSDRGIARAPMWGVYSDEGEWLIEQHGVEPDIEVDNLPHETFNGRDAQLETAIDYLLREIERDPRGIPEPPAYPDLSFDYPEQP